MNRLRRGWATHTTSPAVRRRQQCVPIKARSHALQPLQSLSRRTALNFMPALSTSTLLFQGPARAQESKSDAQKESQQKEVEAKFVTHGQQPSIAAENSVPKVQMAKNLQLSKIVKGCWQLDGEHRGEASSDHTRGTEATKDFSRFLSAGITSWDTADLYGPSEAMIGQFFRLYPEVAAKAQIMTKLSFVGDDMNRISRDMLEFRVNAAVRRMAISHIDVLQLHWDDYAHAGYVDAAQHLADIAASTGLIKHIGLTNFDTPRLLQIVEAGVPILSNQVQYSVLDRRPELYMADMCRSKKISLMAYGTLAGGFLADKYVNRSAKKIKLDTLSKMRSGTILQEVGGWKVLQRVLKALRSVAIRHGVSVSTVAIQWVLQQPEVAVTIVGARNAFYLKDYKAVQTCHLTELDLLDIDAAYESAVQPVSDCYSWERGDSWN